MTVLNVHDDLIEIFAALGLAQTFTYILAIKHAGDLAQQVEVGIGGRLRHQQHEQQIDRHAVDGVEVDCRLQMQDCTDRGTAASQAAVGNGNAVAEAGRAELLAGDEAFEYVLGIQVG